MFQNLADQRRVISAGESRTIPERPLALLRIDCDLYESTMTVLENLYPRGSPGGWVIIDDYGMLPPSRKVVDEFRQERGISAELEKIDEHAVRWKVRHSAAC